MKKILLTILSASVSLGMFADLTGNGYYRVRNCGSERWASLIDNHGAVDYVAGTADVHALQLTEDTETILTDPASIVYFTKQSGNRYNVAAQGTSLEQLVGYPVNIRVEESGSDGMSKYVIYGTKSNVTKYIGDANILPGNYGTATTEPANYPSYRPYRQWYILPLSVTTSNYFAAVPTIIAGGKLYNTLYTSFPYAPYSSGVKAYYIGRVGGGMAEMIEITGTVPEGSPVIIQCAGTEPTDNRLELKSEKASLSGNSLSGVYFNFENNSIKNFVKYDPRTMRVLGATSDGSLGFITDYNLESIPANTAYLVVPKDSPAEFKCVSSSEFTAGVDSVISDSETLVYENGYLNCSQPTEIIIYNLGGSMVARHYGTSINLTGFAKGIYIAKTSDKSLKFVIN